MSVQSQKLVAKALRKIGVPKGSANFGNDQYGDVFATIGKGIQGFVSDPKNIEMVVSVAGGIMEGASVAKAEGATSISTAETAKRQTSTRPKHVNPSDPSILQSLGEYKILVGNIRKDLATKGVLTLPTQWEMTRNALAEELYTKPFTSNYQKASLVYLIKYIDVHLNSNMVPDDEMKKFIHKGHWAGTSQVT